MGVIVGFRQIGEGIGEFIVLRGDFEGGASTVDISDNSVVSAGRNAGRQEEAGKTANVGVAVISAFLGLKVSGRGVVSRGAVNSRNVGLTLAVSKVRAGAISGTVGRIVAFIRSLVIARLVADF